MELDDVHEKALVHATATTVPVALAVAEQSGGISGRGFLDAVTLGNDIACRLALALDMPLDGADRRPRVMSLTYQTGTWAGPAGTRPFFGGRFDYSREWLLYELGERFLGDEISIKPFACCKYGHNVITAVLILRNDPDLSVRSVDEIIVRVGADT